MGGVEERVTRNVGRPVNTEGHRFGEGARNGEAASQREVVSGARRVWGTLKSVDIAHFSHYILVGDINVNFFNHSHPYFSKLFSIFSSFVCHR